MVTPRSDQQLRAQSDEQFPERAPFVERVLDVVARIPRGKVMSYGDIAEYLAPAEEAPIPTTEEPPLAEEVEAGRTRTRKRSE